MPRAKVMRPRGISARGRRICVRQSIRITAAGGAGTRRRRCRAAQARKARHRPSGAWRERCRLNAPGQKPGRAPHCSRPAPNAYTSGQGRKPFSTPSASGAPAGSSEQAPSAPVARGGRFAEPPAAAEREAEELQSPGRSTPGDERRTRCAMPTAASPCWPAAARSSPGPRPEAVGARAAEVINEMTPEGGCRPRGSLPSAAKPPRMPMDTAGQSARKTSAW